MKDAQEDLNLGKMAPEDRMREMVLHEINSCSTSYILDGFPRFYEQYEWLNQHVDYGLIYVNIDVPYNDIISRAILRNRSDDDSIMKKIQFFEEKTEPMIREILSNGECIYNIDNGDDVDIQDAINKLINIVEDNLC
jgi:adenylate kinase family enzyme